jgi:putative transposase
LSIIYNKKIRIEFTLNDTLILDGQSKICNWLYNRLLSACREDYDKNNNSLRLLEGRNLRNYGVSLKEKYPFLNSVFSSVLKEPSARLLRAYRSYFKGNTRYPKYRSWKKKWFSLVFDEPNKGWEIQNEGKCISVSLGNIPGLVKEGRKKNPSIIGKLKEKLKLKENEIIKTFTLCKLQGNNFYAIFSIERCTEKELEYKKALTLYRTEYNKSKKENKQLPKKPKLIEEKIVIPNDAKWIALDPNHKNFFVGIDYKGNSIEFNKLSMLKYWDKKIDEIKSLRDVCEKKYRIKNTKYMNNYTVHSPRWNKLNNTLNRIYNKRREQTKTALYSIARALYKNYDLVIIGDYTPNKWTAPYKNMKRDILNQTKIGEFRRILKWVAIKLEKYYLKVDEHNTTKICCICEHSEKKEPNIRSFICNNCGTELMRDINSSVNIAKKAKYSLNTAFIKEKLNKFTYRGEARYGEKIKWS